MEAKVIRDFTDRFSGATILKDSVIEVSEERFEELKGKRKVVSLVESLGFADRPVITDPGLTDNKIANPNTDGNKTNTQAPPPPPPSGTGTASGSFNPPPPPPPSGTGTIK